MNNTRFNFEAHRYKAVRAAVLAEFGDLDAQTLADTVEGLTDFADVLAADVRAALDDEMMASMLKVRMDQMADRRDRFEARAEKLRQVVRDAMIEADVHKIVKEDFTASLRRNPPHLQVIDETLIPKDYFEQRPHLLRGKVTDALKNGAEITGATLNNPDLSLAIRTR